MYETPVKKHFIGNLFRVIDDPFYFDLKTNDQVRNVLASIFQARTLKSQRVRIWYGNVQTGRAWNDTYNVSGYIGRTADRYPRPAVMGFKSSLEGDVIHTSKIVRIDIVETGETVYAHESFHVVAFSSLANARESEHWNKAISLVRQCRFKLNSMFARLA